MSSPNVSIGDLSKIKKDSRLKHAEITIYIVLASNKFDSILNNHSD